MNVNETEQRDLTDDGDVGVELKIKKVRLLPLHPRLSLHPTPELCTDCIR